MGELTVYQPAWEPQIYQGAVDVRLVRQSLTITHAATTKTGYSKDLVNFFLYLTAGFDDWDVIAGQRESLVKDKIKARLNELSLQFVQLGRIEAIAKLASYREAQREAGLSAATINRRLASVKAMVKQAQTLELCDWSLAEVKGLKSEAYRDTSGVDAEAYGKILELIDRSSLKGKRDFALMHLLFTSALRRAEAAEVSLKDFDSHAMTLSIMGKGKSERVKVDLAPDTVAALDAWMSARGDVPQKAPMFIAVDRCQHGHRLSTTSIYRVVRARAKAAGVSSQFSPHKIRHSSITAYLESSDGDIRGAQNLARHADPRVTGRYDDKRRQTQKKASEVLGKLI